ncbi:XRE family transcriptional regulator [Pseudomonas saudimassiliensis]|uniref:XRE family transcriptional regulator n=1 Tax=Pseudomonas saudimassiliensis TaxID=1461581 RepID=A0A078MCC2_9PSED|nr:helix-turn-helix domain-containing protein [Pseudomonas saudimassiliensis]CEA03072.1 XRE family transcriptional regulator [Pseudomonas saudimassiliensis]CEF26063.1 XRE family transcriptional regulator [Pseudomonas saudimassiliensis]
MADEVGTTTGAEQAGRVNPGEVLRAERERVGFTADEVATHLRLTRATLGYLEAGRFERLPGDTFARGYVRAYARLLKLDPARFVEQYDRYVGINSRESSVHTIDKVDVKPKRGARVVMTVSTLLIILIMVSLGLWWWNDSRETPSRGAEPGTLDEVQVDSMLPPDSFTSSFGDEPNADAAVADEALSEPAEGATAPACRTGSGRGASAGAAQPSGGDACAVGGGPGERTRCRPCRCPSSCSREPGRVGNDLLRQLLGAGQHHRGTGVAQSPDAAGRDTEYRPPGPAGSGDRRRQCRGDD